MAAKKRKKAKKQPTTTEDVATEYLQIKVPAEWKRVIVAAASADGITTSRWVLQSCERRIPIATRNGLPKLRLRGQRREVSNLKRPD